MSASPDGVGGGRCRTVAATAAGPSLALGTTCGIMRAMPRARVPLMALATYLMLTALTMPWSAAADQLPFEEAVRNLRNPDLAARLTALRLLKESGYVEAAAPVAPLLTDLEDVVQLAAIEAELTFYVPGRSSRRRVALVVEQRHNDGAERVFLDGPLAVTPQAVAPEVMGGLAAAMRDETPRVRLDATYTLGVLAPRYAGLSSPMQEEVARSIGGGLSRPDPATRVAAARVGARLWRGCGASGDTAGPCQIIGDALIHGINARERDVTIACMDAVGELRSARAVQALTDRVQHYGPHGAIGRAAFDALARIGHPSSASMFTALLVDRDPRIRRIALEGLARTGDRTFAQDLHAMAGLERSATVNLALSYALVRIGVNADLHPLIRALDHQATRLQAASYLAELAPTAAASLFPYLTDASGKIRAALADVLGFCGVAGAIPALEPLTTDPDATVAASAARAIARLQLDGR